MPLRPATETDLPAITDIYNHAILTSTATFDLEPRMAAEQQAWFARHGPDQPVLVWENEKEVVAWGSVSYFGERPAYHITGETSIYVADGNRGQGIGREILRVLVEEAHRIGYHSLVARIAEGNKASIRLHERFGFEVVGVLKEAGRKFDRLIDVYFMQLMMNRARE
jgi:phosphinothricin acetyltransferase